VNAAGLPEEIQRIERRPSQDASSQAPPESTE